MAKAAPVVQVPPTFNESTIKVISSQEVSKIIVEAVTLLLIWQMSCIQEKIPHKTYFKVANYNILGRKIRFLIVPLKIFRRSFFVVSLCLFGLRRIFKKISQRKKIMISSKVRTKFKGWSGYLVGAQTIE